MLYNETNDFKFDKHASVELISWSSNEIIFKTIAKSKQFLNISEVYYKDGWVVNDSIKIYEVNNLIRGIFVEPGENIYSMKYKPREVILGKSISLVSFLILIILIFFGIWRENKK